MVFGRNLIESVQAPSSADKLLTVFGPALDGLDVRVTTEVRLFPSPNGVSLRN